MPVFELQTPDGRTFEVEAPDMNTAAQSLDAIRGGEGDSDAPQKGAARDAAEQFFERFNRGLYSAANFPTSLANMATGAMGIDYQFKRPLEVAAPGFDQMAMEVPEAQTAGGKVAGSVGEFMGANSLPAMGTIAAAPRLAAATTSATGLGGQVVHNTARGVANAPGTAAAGEMLSSIGSGVGASMAEGQGPTAEYLAATAGGMLAPMSLAVSPTNLARKGAQKVAKRFSPEQLAKQQRRQLTEGLRRDITPEGRAAIHETLEIQRDIPDYRPSVAEATENPSLIATQREFEANLSGPTLDRASRRYGANEAAINRAIREQAPQSSMDLDDAVQAGRQRLQGIAYKLDDQVRALDTRERGIADRLQAGQRQREMGKSIRDKLIDRRASIKEEMSITAREMGLNDSQARFPFENLKHRLKAAVEPRSKLSDPAAQPSHILADLDRMDDSASIVDLMELRSRISADIREAARTPTGEKRIPHLQAMKTELDAATDELIRSAGDSDLAENLKRFRQIYREDYILPFEQGAAARALKTDVAGAYVVADERVAKEFFDGWNQTAADQFNQVFPRTANARRAMESVALDDLHNFATRDGALNPALVESWRRKNAGVLKAFPEIDRQVRDVEGLLSDIATRRATLLARKKQAQNSVLSRELKRVENTSATPEAVISQAIGNPNRMMRVMGGLKTKPAKEAVSRQAWETALRSNNPSHFLEQNAGSMRIALGSERYELAKRLARAIDKNKLVPRPAGRALDTNPMATVENYLGTGLNQLSSRVFAVKSGRTSARYALADIVSRTFNSMSARQAQDFLNEVLYDPKVAADLANALEFETMPEKSAKRLYTFLISNGIVAAQDDEDTAPMAAAGGMR